MWGLFTDGPDYKDFLEECAQKDELIRKQQEKERHSKRPEFDNRKNMRGVGRAQTFTRSIGYK